MPKSIIVIAEIAADKIAPVTYEVVAAAEKLAEHHDLPLNIWILGADIEHSAKQLAVRTGHHVTGFACNISAYQQDAYCEILAARLPGTDPAYICTAHTARGLDFAPALAARLNAACITGVESIQNVKGNITLYRRIHNGRLMAGITPMRTPTILTVPPGIFKRDKKSDPPARRRPSVQVEPVSVASCGIQPVGVRREHGTAGSLKAADVIVTAGNGIGKAENIDLIYQLANIFPKSAVAGSRPVCDRKILPYNRQVGITGAVVNPKLYIACGVSGSSQHVAGMRESGLIVSINTDPNAAISNYADICVTEDLKTFIPVLLKRLRE